MWGAFPCLPAGRGTHQLKRDRGSRPTESLNIGQTVMGDDVRMEARGSKNEAQASYAHIRVSIQVSTTTDVDFNLTIRASSPLPNLPWI
jgi:hypothetical protein